jgi:hypothetical protein
MTNINRIPSSNCSSQAIFLLKGAKKRRTMAINKAKMMQCEQGIMPRLVAVK